MSLNREFVLNNQGLPRLRIYFAGSISGGRALQPFYKSAIDYLEEVLDHEVLSAHVGDPNLGIHEQLSDPAIYERDIAWINQADLIIAEISNPSTGVGIEIGYALWAAGKRVYCLYQSEVRATAMALGNDHPKLSCFMYEPYELSLKVELLFTVRDFLIEQGYLENLKPRVNPSSSESET